MDSHKLDCSFSPPSYRQENTNLTTIYGGGEMVVAYKECQKNHAASFGGHALDGCGEFMPSPTSNPTDPSSLRCAACGCHRNFHRRDHSDNTNNYRSPTPTTASDPPSPPPIHSVAASPVPYSYYTSAPHVLLSLSAGLPGPSDHDNDATETYPTAVKVMRKRTRTKFTAEQKIKMRAFAEKSGWKINGCDEESVKEFCNEIGIDRCVLKVWMHNNKYSSVNGKNKDLSSPAVVDRRLCLNSYSYNNGGDGTGNGHDVRIHVSGDGSSSS